MDVGAKGYGTDLDLDSTLAFNDDVAGERRFSGRWDIGASVEARSRERYRSIGFNNNSPIAVGAATTNEMSVTGTVITFEQPQPVNMGVGDAILYDSDNVAGYDDIVFIHERISSTQYFVRKADGSHPSATVNANEDEWKVCRAYNSTYNAERGSENTACMSTVALQNFDLGDEDITDISGSAEQFHFAIYAGDGAETSYIVVRDWVTAAENYIRFFAPHLPSSLVIQLNYVRMEGLQFQNSAFNSEAVLINAPSAVNSDIRFSHNIVFTDITESSSYAIDLTVGIGKIWNNIFIGTGGIDVSIGGNGGIAYVYNNTVLFGNGSGIGTWTAPVIAKNNLVYSTSGTTGGYNGAAFDTVKSTNNLFGPGSSPSIPPNAAINNASPLFVDSDANDYRISLGDTWARGQGANLSIDPDGAINITDDIAGNPRSAPYDIGASVAVSSLDPLGIARFRSVGPGNTGYLAQGAAGTNEMSINGSGILTFENPQPDNIGVGDAVEYDADDTGGIDNVVFIHERLSDTQYLVRNADGSLPNTAAADTQAWNICRAYTSFISAEAGGPRNTCINAGAPAFDGWGTGKDISSATGSNEQFHYAMYADADEVITANGSISGWTTSPDNYVRVFTPSASNEVGVSQRHNGVWGSGYKISRTATADYQTVFYVLDDHVKIEGIQVEIISSSTFTSSNGIRVENNGPGSEVYISKNIIRANRTGTGNSAGIYVLDPDLTAYIWNNIVYDFIGGGGSSTGIHAYDASGTQKAYVYNNTVYNTAICFRQSNSTYVAKNNIAQGCTNGFSGSFDAASDYNVSNLAADAPSPSYRSGLATTVTFRDAANDDFTLSPRDVYARSTGVNLNSPQDLYLTFTDDVASNSRLYSAWDIGASKDVNSVDRYRSIGEGNDTPLATGALTTNEMSITDSIITFEQPQPDNIGIGDAIEYDADNVAGIDAVVFIHERISDTQYLVRTALGGTATPTTNANEEEWKICRAYTSMYNAERRTTNSVCLADNIQNFDSSGSVIITKEFGVNERRHYAIYADGTAATQRTDVFGWTTGPDNYLRFYTPYLPSEVGVSQRHSGIWDATKATHIMTNLNATNIQDAHVRLEGLMIDITGNGNEYGVYVSANYPYSEVHISDSIIRLNASSTMNNYGIGGDGGNTRIYNNLIYGNCTSGV
jgi:hypothetical protein